jgi:hypothetical protein
MKSLELLMAEQIELADPIWEKQEDESGEHYLLFARYYLPFGLGGATRAFKRYKALHKQDFNEIDEYLEKQKKQKKNGGINALSKEELMLVKGVDADTLGNWYHWEKKYQWKKRHQSYHLWKGGQDLEKMERRQSIQMSRIANIIDASIDRAEEIMNMPSTERQITQLDENGNPLVIILQPRQSRDYRDAVELLKAGQSILEDYGVVGKANRYVKFLTDHGFEVTESDVLPGSTPKNLLAPAGEDENYDDEDE